MTRRLARQMALATAVMAALVGACHEDNPCDVGFVLNNDVCIPAPVGDAGSEAVEAGPPTFGTLCRTQSDCTGEVNGCLIMPGGAEGFCSVSGCDSNPALCPADWTCYDLSKIVPAAPWACVPKALVPSN